MFVRNRTALLFNVVLLVAALTTPIVQAAEPNVVISLKSYKEISEDVLYLGTTLGAPQIGLGLPFGLTMAFGGQFPEGFDQTKPLVVYMSVDESGQPEAGAFCIPVTNAKAFAKSLSKAAAESSTEGEVTTYQFAASPMPMVGKAIGKYFFLTPFPDSLNDAPDPAKLAKANADVAVEFRFGNIADELKEGMVAQIAAQAAANSETGGGEIESKGRELGNELALAGIRRIIMDGESISISLNVDKSKRNVTFEFGVVAKPNTALAESCNALGKMTSPYLGMITAKTAASLICSAPLSEQAVSALKLTFAAAREGVKKSHNGGAQTDDDKAAVELVSQLIDSLEKSTPTDRIDHAYVVNHAENGKVEFISAQRIKNGKALAETIDKSITTLLESDKTATIGRGVAKVGGGTAHRVNLPPDAESPFSEHLGHFVATEDTAALAVGAESLKLLGNAFEKRSGSTEKSAPIALRIKFANLIPILPPESRIPEEITQKAFAEGLDEFSLQIVADQQSSRLQFVLQEGVLKLIALAGQRIQPGN